MENQPDSQSLNKPYKGYSIIGAYLKMFCTFRISGRATLSEYWWPALVQNIIWIGAWSYSDMMEQYAAEGGLAYTGVWNVSLNIVDPITNFIGCTRDDVLIILGVFFLVYGVATLWQYIALTVRRLHDTGRSGVMFLLSFIPLVGPIILLYFLTRDSERGPNMFGESEKYPTKQPAPEPRTNPGKVGLSVFERLGGLIWVIIGLCLGIIPGILVLWLMVSANKKKGFARSFLKLMNIFLFLCFMLLATASLARCVASIFIEAHSIIS